MKETRAHRPRSSTLRATLTRMCALLLACLSLAGCDWDKEALERLKEAQKFVEQYAGTATKICMAISAASRRDACLAQVQKDHAIMQALVVKAVVAHASCDEVLFKESLEAIRDVGNKILQLGLNSVLPVASSTPTQLQMLATSADGVHFGIAGDSGVWLDTGEEGEYVAFAGQLSLAFEPTEAGLVAIVADAQLVATVRGMPFILHLASGEDLPPSVLQLAPAPGAAGAMAGTLHLMVGANLPYLGTSPIKMALPVSTSAPGSQLFFGGAGLAPFGTLFPTLLDIAQGTADCNGDGVPDWAQIAAGELEDCDLNWVPDVCQAPGTLLCSAQLAPFTPECPLFACPSHSCGPARGDLNGDGAVNVADVQCGILAVLTLMATGEPNPPCLVQTGAALDLSCDGLINVSDIMMLVQKAFSLPLPAAIDADGNGCPDACDPMTCADGDACTVDQFVPGTGCVHTPLTCVISDDACAEALCAPAAGCLAAPLIACGPSEPPCVGGQCPSPPLEPACAAPLGGAGCAHGGCEACVCAQDPFCCDTQWDGLCAALAAGGCATACGEPAEVGAWCNADPAACQVFLACGDAGCDPPSEAIDPVADLAGVLDLELMVLCVAPKETAVVCQALGATCGVKAGVGFLDLGAAGGGASSSVTFEIAATEDPAQCDAAFSQIDPASPRHRVYREAQCETEIIEAETECRAKAEGSFYIRSFEAFSKCQKGTGYCVEVDVVWIVDRTYEDPHCSVLIDVDVAHRNFFCKP